METDAKKTVMELRGIAGGFRKSIVRRFNEADVAREGMNSHTSEGENFASTITVAVTETHDPNAVVVVAQTLDSILNLPNAGTISWHMRAFIRRATTHQVIEYAGYIRTICEIDPSQLQLADIKNRDLVIVELDRLKQLASCLLPDGTIA